MLSIIKANWETYISGHSYKTDIDAICKKNMDSYSAEVFNDDYLPNYSTRESTEDWNDRLNRAKNGYMNFIQKIVDIYQNSVFRTTSKITRESDNAVINRFMNDCDGAGTHIGDFVREQIFILNQVHGGLFIVIDKPKSPDNDTWTKRDQNRSNFYPYAYLKKWPDVTNFGVDRHNRLDWIMFKEAYLDDAGNKNSRYRYFDKTLWALLDGDGKAMDGGDHNLGRVPIIQVFDRRRPDHEYLTPRSPLDDIVRLTLKIFEYQSQLEQMIINHAFMKLAMPKGMWDAMKDGFGNKNVFVFPNGTGSEDRAYYIESTMQEIEKMINLVYTVLPDKIFYFATLRDKVAMPREESGKAKMIDSSDETTNLLHKANVMEWTEREMVKLAALWEKQSNPDFKIVYDKIFDIKSTYEQIEELERIFKQDMGSPQFNKEMMKRLMINMLGGADDETKTAIIDDLENSIDPAINTDDMDQLINYGILNAIKLARKYNPEWRQMSDDEIREMMMANLELVRASKPPAPMFGQEQEPEENEE